jgi:hypothetical protein
MWFSFTKPVGTPTQAKIGLEWATRAHYFFRAGWPSFSFACAATEEAAPAFLLLESWAPRNSAAARQTIFRTFISAFCFSFTSTIPRSPSE